jgi:thiaminase (transcriptional activator TenA)
LAERSFSTRLRDASGDIWRALGEHPFLRELAAGDLSPDVFRFYLEQNLLYLSEYARAIALGASKSRSGAELARFTRALVNIVEVEIPENRALLDRVVALGATDRGGAAAMAPGCLAYTSWLISTAARGGPLEIMTAILPCAWSYGDIARRLDHGVAAEAVYAEWIRFFASPEYDEIVQRMRHEIDEMATGAGASQEGPLFDLFAEGCRLELGFWEMAYRLEQWPDVRGTSGPAPAPAEGRPGR